jgi:apolipoprotein N-acyltransferase
MGETRNSSLVHRVPDGAIAVLLVLELKGVNVLGLAWMYRFVGRVIAMFLLVVWLSTALAVGLTHACACSQRCDKKVVSNVKSDKLELEERSCLMPIQ